MQLRRALDAAGHASTLISLPDGVDPAAILAAARTNATFRAAIDSIGRHYPCSAPDPAVQDMGE